MQSLEMPDEFNQCNFVPVKYRVAKGKASPVVSSRKVAEVFEKEHKNVLRDIQALECDKGFSRLNFEPSTYISDHGKEYPEYLMTRIGFSVLTMGFTGAKARLSKSTYLDGRDAPRL